MFPTTLNGQEKHPFLFNLATKSWESLAPHILGEWNQT